MAALILLRCPAHPAICGRNAHRTVQGAPKPAAGTCPEPDCPRRSYRAYGVHYAGELRYRLLHVGYGALRFVRGLPTLPRRLWLARHAILMALVRGGSP